jgi:hypothetical protein
MDPNCVSAQSPVVYQAPPLHAPGPGALAHTGGQQVCSRPTTLSAQVPPGAPHRPAMAGFLWSSGAAAFRPASFSSPTPSDVFRTDSLVSPTLALLHAQIRFQSLPEEEPSIRDADPSKARGHDVPGYTDISPRARSVHRTPQVKLLLRLARRGTSSPPGAATAAPSRLFLLRYVDLDGAPPKSFPFSASAFSAA